MEWSIISVFTWSMSPEFPTSSDELQTDFGKFYIVVQPTVRWKSL